MSWWVRTRRKELLAGESVRPATDEERNSINFVNRFRPESDFSTPEERVNRDRAAREVRRILTEDPGGVALVINSDTSRMGEIRSLLATVGLDVMTREAVGSGEYSDPFTFAVQRRREIPKKKKEKKFRTSRRRHWE